ncbi:MAG: histidinol-phosphate transaminase [Emcibacteraceae bacterium]|nr:histidinol-phosphate transaminase [Emcibacteraceae bacterium]
MSGPKTHSWINDLNVYITGKSKVGDFKNPHKLSANESALGPSPMAMEAYKKAASELHRYPDPTYNELRTTLAKKYDIEPEQILCGVGSDEILKLACRAYLKPGDEALYVAHSFSMYPIAIKSVGGIAIEVKDVDYTADIDNIIKAITDKTRIIFIANPNNPTGTYLSVNEIERLWQNVPEHILLVLDAAYAEFVSNDDYDAGIELAGRASNVLMTRTFSKLYGLAALRLGWGYACKEISKTLDKIRDPFNVPSSAQVAGVAALNDLDFQKKATSFNQKWRTWLERELSALGLMAIPSATNFILFGFENKNKSAKDANDFLTQRGYILRYYSGQGLENFLRLTVGTEKENKEIIKLLKEFLEI